MNYENLESLMCRKGNVFSPTFISFIFLKSETKRQREPGNDIGNSYPYSLRVNVALRQHRFSCLTSSEIAPKGNPHNISMKNVVDLSGF